MSSEKKKIFIMMSAMHLGGVETALLGLLEALDYSKVDVDLFLYRHDGELMPYIPKQVNILPENTYYACMGESVKQSFRRGHFFVALTRLVAHCYSKIRYATDEGSINGDISFKMTRYVLPQINSHIEYDLAVSFIFPHYFVPYKVRAKKKIAWIHTDYTSVQIRLVSLLKMWKLYDKIISISESVSNAFLTVFPTLKKKLTIIENILPQKYIEARCEEYPEKINMMKNAHSKFKLLSIGRYCIAKNFDNIPEICRLIREKGVDVIWYIIGYGSDEILIKEKIKGFGVEKYVILLGKQENPYPFIKECDLYVQPSRYEGKSVAVREAQLLGKPVVVTAFKTAQSQLKDGLDGIIVPMDNEGCAMGIAEILRDPQKMFVLAENCKKNDVALKKEVIKFHSLID